MSGRFSLLLCFVIACMLSVSCKQAAEKQHLPKEKMQQILLDINLAESYSTMVPDSLHKKDTKNTDSLAVYYKAIFNHHHITQEEFANSLSWYKKHPDDIDSLYAGILSVVDRMQAVPK